MVNKYNDDDDNDDDFCSNSITTICRGFVVNLCICLTALTSDHFDLSNQLIYDYKLDFLLSGCELSRGCTSQANTSVGALRILLPLEYVMCWTNIE